MSQYSWATCPSSIRAQINKLIATLQQILGNNLVGVYLHGSLAMGCLNPRCSDIDLLVVTSNRMSVETKRTVAQYLLKHSLAPAPIEISFLVQPDIHPYQHPLPYDMHYSESWRARYTQMLANGTWHTWNDEKKYDQDLAAHITIIRARGICLSGKPIQEVFPIVRPAFYAASLLADFDDAKAERQHMPVYFTLNACRVLAYLREGHIYSKDEGGVWGLQMLPAELHAIVRQALETYRGNLMDASFDETALTRLAHYMDMLFLRL